MKSFRLGESSESVANGDVTYRRPHTRLLVFLVVLFALATVALAIVLAFTVLKVKEDDAKLQETTCRPAASGKGQQQGTGVTTPSPSTQTNSDDVCQTEGCVIAAARVVGAMDTTADPCEDFYQFACGKWLQRHVIPEDKGSFGTFTQLRDDVSVIMKSVLEVDNKAEDPEAVIKARNYYKACADEEKIEKLGLTYIHKYMEDLSGWPVMGSSPGGKWNVTQYNFEDLLLLIRRGTNSLPFIDIGVMQDSKNPEHYILAMDQPTLGMPSRDYYLKKRNDTTLMAYQKMIEEIAIAFGADAHTAKADAEEMVNMEIQMANITVPKEERRDPEKLYNKMTVADLSNNFTGADWTKLLQGMMQIVGTTVTGTEPIIVMAPTYFDKLETVINSFSSRVMANYLICMRVISKTMYLPEEFTDIKLKYQKVLTGTASKPPRWQSCGDRVTSSLPEVAGRLFVEKSFKEEAKQDVLILVGKLRESFKEMIDNLPWMEDTTKATAKAKADAIDPRIGYPEMVYNGTALNEKYKEVTITVGDPLQSLVSLGDASVIRQLNKLRKSYDYSQWDMAAALVNAYYNPETNQITFPAAILQPPFYTKDQPAYLNYGGIGYVIGHEITHGFDDQGRLYDKEGHLNPWWSDTDAAKFKKRAQCIIDQYSNFTVPGTGNMTLNGINTQGENIADNGGIKESYKAYRKWIAERGEEEKKLPGLPYSSNQLYFLNAAQVWCDKMRNKAKIERIRTDPHSIAKYRVYGPLQNFEEFSTAWNCKPGSFMNRKNKCAVW